MFNFNSHIKLEKGLTLIELLVVLSLTGMVFYGVMTQFSSSINLSHDHDVRIATMLEAQAIMQSVGSEVRMIGNGVPFDQANFTIGELGLSDITHTYPIDLAYSDGTQIRFRINETGEVYMLSNSFDPTSSTTVTLNTVSDISVGDSIYMSNSVVAGDDGLYAEVSSVNSGTNTVSLTNLDYLGTPSFAVGSIFEVVPQVSFANSASGITRDSGPGAILLGNNSTLTLDYLDNSGTSLALPLSEIDIVNSLRSIRLTIVHTSSSPLRDGTDYTVTLDQVFGIRNLNYLY